MIYYFLFGEEPVGQYWENNGKITSKDGYADEWDDAKDTPADLLSSYSGWGSFTYISEKEYKKFKKHFK